jgi:uncharacterized damage-inducible protein DinB
MKNHFAMLARYNLWATRKLYESVDALSEAAYRGDSGLFFRSIHGTLNHLLVGSDLLWYPRFAAGVSPQGVKLADEVEPDRGRLKERLVRNGERWCALVETFPDDRYPGQIDYVTMRGTRAVLPFAATLAHVFNHGTHHRGQISVAITAQGGECPELDLVYMLQQEQADGVA